jgi:hypothetical protein
MSTRLQFEHPVDARDRIWISEWATVTGGGTEPPIWRRSRPADEVLSPAQNGVIGAAMTRTHAEKRTSKPYMAMAVPFGPTWAASSGPT